MCVHPRACPSYFWSHFEYFMFNQYLFSTLIPLYRAVMYTWYPVCIASLLKQHVLKAESHPAIDKLPPSNLGALCKLFMCVCLPARSTALITYLSDRCNDVCIVNVCLISFSFLGLFLKSMLDVETSTEHFYWWFWHPPGFWILLVVLQVSEMHWRTPGVGKKWMCEII